MWQAELSSFKGLGWERGSFFPPHQPSMWIQSLWSPLKRTCQCLHPPKRLECTLYQHQPCLSFIPLFTSVGRAVPAPALQQGRKRWFFWGGKEYRLPLPPPALCWSNVGATEPAHPQAWGKEKGMGARWGQDGGRAGDKANGVNVVISQSEHPVCYYLVLSCLVHLYIKNCSNRMTLESCPLLYSRSADFNPHLLYHTPCNVNTSSVARAASKCLHLRHFQTHETISS